MRRAACDEGRGNVTTVLNWNVIADKDASNSPKLPKTNTECPE